MKKFLFLLVVVFLTTSCFKNSDINIDPNRSTSVDPSLLFAGAATQFSLLRVGRALGLATVAVRPNARA
ncbi:MAG: hypothetical protein MUE81_24255 [Thermoflexibacter sp.]|nr:hypothetical protein [Thermoflexibacter sp.]